MDTYVHAYILKKSLNSLHCHSTSSFKGLLVPLLMTHYSLLCVEQSRAKSRWPSEYLQVHWQANTSTVMLLEVFRVAPAVCSTRQLTDLMISVTKHGEGNWQPSCLVTFCPLLVFAEYELEVKRVQDILSGIEKPQVCLLDLSARTTCSSVSPMCFYFATPPPGSRRTSSHCKF